MRAACQKSGSKSRRDVGERVVHEHRGGQREAEHYWHSAGDHREQAARGAKPVLWQVAIFAGGVMEAPLASEAALAEQQGGDEQQHDAGDLGGAGQAIAVEPGIVDGDGQGLNAEELDRPDIVQSFHHRESDARRERRPRQRKRHLPERLGWTSPERPAYLEHTYRLGEEARPRGDVDVRVEDGAHDQDRAAQAPDVGKPIGLGVAPPESGAQARLHDARIIEHLQKSIGDDVGRNRKRQQQ